MRTAQIGPDLRLKESRQCDASEFNAEPIGNEYMSVYIICINQQKMQHCKLNYRRKVKLCSPYAIKCSLQENNHSFVV